MIRKLLTMLVVCLFVSSAGFCSVSAKTKLTVWTLLPEWAAGWERTLETYSETHPDITSEVLQVPWGEYWKKLTAAIPAGKGPDMYVLHGCFLTPHIIGGFAAPYPEDMFPREKLKAEYPFSEAFYYEGKIYTFPIGLGVTQLYYNKTIFRDGGLAFPDINDWPKTWDEALGIAKKLTKYDDNGNVIQAGYSGLGFSFFLWYNMIYQQGRWFFAEDGRSVQTSTEEARKALQFIWDLYHTDKVSSPTFPGLTQAFGTGKSAMTAIFPWLSTNLQINSPDLDWGVCPLPTFTGEPLPAWGLIAHEPWLVVNNRISDERKRVAFDVIRTLLFEDDENMVEFVYEAGYLPQKVSLRDNERFNSPWNRISAKMAPYSILMMEEPMGIWQDIRPKYIEDGIKTGMSVDQMLKLFTAAANRDMEETGYLMLPRKDRYEYSYLFKADAE